MAEEPDEVTLPMSWIGFDEERLDYANVFLSQFQEDEFVISFGNVTPPVIVGDEEMRRQQLQELQYVPVRTTARIAVTPSRMRQLVQMLTENLAKFDQANSGDQGETDNE